MAKRLHPLIALNKDVAEAAFGHEKGLPTFSQRFGRPMGRALGIGPHKGVDLFHMLLFVGGAAALLKSASSKTPKTAFGGPGTETFIR